MRYAGKSTFSEILSQMLNYGLVDMDADILREYQMDEPDMKSLFDVTARFGWKHFRETEHERLQQIIKHFSDYNNHIVSTGGGISVGSLWN